MRTQFASVNATLCNMTNNIDNFGQRIDSLERKIGQDYSVLSTKADDVVDRVTRLENSSDASQDLVNRVAQLELASDNSEDLTNRVVQLEQSPNICDEVANRLTQLHGIIFG